MDGKSASGRAGHSNRRKISVPSIESVILSGFKAHRDECRIQIAPMTVLCGANSSGKSSVMQALLLLKQTEDPDADPGPLKVDEPHVRFESFSDFAWHGKSKADVASTVELGLSVNGVEVTSTFKAHGKGVYVVQTLYRLGREPSGIFRVRPGSHPDNPTLSRTLGSRLPDDRDFAINVAYSAETISNWMSTPTFGRTRRWTAVAEPPTSGFRDALATGDFQFLYGSFLRWNQMNPAVEEASMALRSILHLPGSRGNPARRYPFRVPDWPRAAVPFSELFASVLADWDDDANGGLDRLHAVTEIMQTMGLGWKVAASRSSMADIIVKVSRTARPRQGSAWDMVHIADVGFGVSQVLPAVVALVHAVDGQLVYIEQPEIHLHPRAQRALVDAAVSAVRRGVRVVLETHSETVLLAVRLAVARGSLKGEETVFHWFERDDNGIARVTSAQPDSRGACEGWSSDFGDRMMDLQGEYLEAAAAVTDA